MPRSTFFVLGMIVSFGSSSLAAQGSPSESTEADAAARFQAALVLYDRGDYRAAADEFDALLDVYPSPELRFNAFRARLNAGDIVRARDHLRAYLLVASEGAERTQLENQLALLEEEIQRRDRAGATGEAPPSRDGATPIESSASFPTGPVILSATAVLMFVGATATGVLALSAESDLEDACPGGVCGPDQADTKDRLELLAPMTDVLLGVGAAAAIGSLVWWLVWANERSTPPTVAAACDGAGCRLGLNGTF